jgi:hypothetical protein
MTGFFTENNEMPALSHRLDWPFVDHFVNQAVGLGFLWRHEKVAISIRLDAIKGLAGTLGKLPVQLVFQIENFIGLNANITGLAPGTSQGLVDHDA